MREHIIQNDDASLEAVTEKAESAGLLRRMRPSDEMKELARAQGEGVRAAAERRAAMLRLYGDVQYKIAEKESEALLKGLGIDLQGQLAAFAMDRLSQLRRTIDRRQDEFLEEFVVQLDKAERYADRPSLHSALVRSLEKQQTMYFETCEQLYDGFQQQLRTQLPER